MGPNGRAIQAINAMKDMGITEKRVKPVLKKLLRLYDKNWELIEDENYRVLIDAIFEQEKEEEATKTNEEEQLREEFAGPPLKKMRLRGKGDAASYSGELTLPIAQSVEHDPLLSQVKDKNVQEALALPLALSRLDEEEKSQLCLRDRAEHHPISTQTRSRDKGKDPVLPSSVCHAMEIAQNRTHLRQKIVVHDSTSPQTQLKTKEMECSSPRMTHKEKGGHHARPTFGMCLKEPKIEPGIIISPKEKLPDSRKSNGLIMPKSEPPDDYPPLVPIAILPPASYERTIDIDPFEDGHLTLNGSTVQVNGVESLASKDNHNVNSDRECAAVTSSELATVPEAPMSFEIASSPLGEVRISLNCNQSFERPDLRVPSLEEVLKAVEDKCLRSYRILDPNFSIMKLMQETCQSFLDLSNKPSNSNDDGLLHLTSDLNFSEKPNLQNAFGAIGSQPDYIQLPTSFSDVSSNAQPSDEAVLPEPSNMLLLDGLESYHNQETDGNLNGERDAEQPNSTNSDNLVVVSRQGFEVAGARPIHNLPNAFGATGSQQDYIQFPTTLSDVSSNAQPSAEAVLSEPLNMLLLDGLESHHSPETDGNLNGERNMEQPNSTNSGERDMEQPNSTNFGERDMEQPNSTNLDNLVVVSRQGFTVDGARPVPDVNDSSKGLERVRISVINQANAVLAVPPNTLLLDGLESHHNLETHGNLNGARGTEQPNSPNSGERDMEQPNFTNSNSLVVVSPTLVKGISVINQANAVLAVPPNMLPLDGLESHHNLEIDGNLNGARGTEQPNSPNSGERDMEQPNFTNSNSLIVISRQGFAVDGARPLHDVNDISKGQERVRISVINEVSSVPYPSSFYYIRRNTVYQSADLNFPLARIGDDDCCSNCFGDCLSSSIPCACARDTGGDFAYTLEGRVKEDFLDECISMNQDPPQQHRHFYCEQCPKEGLSETCKGHLVKKFIKECWNKCGCYKQCGNRVVQRGIACNLQVFFTSEGKGWGVRTLEDLPKGTFVCEYVGEVLTTTELYERNMQSTGNEKLTYPVLLDAAWGSEAVLKDEAALCLDATYYGNVARFVNHRCFDANMVGIPVEIETPDHHYYHLAFFTTRDVDALEELTWDYGIDFDDNSNPVKAFRCCCKSNYCRDLKRYRRFGPQKSVCITRAGKV